MTHIRFDTTLYDPGAIKSAVGAFAGCAKIEVAGQDGYVTLDVVAIDSSKQQMVDGELSNYVLGATVDFRTSALGIPQR